MQLSDFYTYLQSEIQHTIQERINSSDEEFPSDELVFSEKIINQMVETGISHEAQLCHWNGKIGNAKLGITGYAANEDFTSLEIFVAKYFDTEDISTLDTQSAQSTIKEALRFVTACSDGNIVRRLDPTHPVRDLAATVNQHWLGIDKLKITLITNARAPFKKFANQEISGKIISPHVVDIERLFRLTEGKPRDEISLSLVQAIGRPLPCVHVANPEADYDYALTALPGELLKELYLQFDTRLLEANVRTFLGTKKSVNKGIVETLKKEPEHFLAFNNGLVLVCDEAKFEKTDDGFYGLSFIKGLQIVNGGQTTSTIYFASRDDRTIDLSHVMVPAKIIIIKGSDDHRDSLISNVSRFANSQTAVKASDLSSNKPFHIQLEKLANEIWCPDGATRWFYERAAGAYNVMLLKEGKTKSQRDKIQQMISTKRKLSKNDVAKYYESWRGVPHQVAMAGEKNFAAFMDAIDQVPSVVPNPLDAKWYKTLIAKVILFKSVENMIKTKEAKNIFKQAWGNITSYAVALVAHNYADQINLEKIWLNQSISSELSGYMWRVAIIINDEFERIGAGQQYSELAKRASTWEAVRKSNIPSPTTQIPEIIRN